jgi:Ca2+-binding EF-hand superfamily protein
MQDMDKDGFLNLTEFRKSLRDHRIDVTDSEIDMVFQYFDRDVTGLVDLWGIMYVFKGELGPQRQQLVEQVFQKIDSDNDQVVTIA